MAIEKSQTGAEIKEKAAKAVRKRKVFVGVDKTFEDVVQLQDEGHDLYFEDSEDRFLTLTAEQVSELKPHFQTRYHMCEKIANGDDVIGTAVEGTKGYSTNFATRPEVLVIILRSLERKQVWIITGYVMIVSAGIRAKVGLLTMISQQVLFTPTRKLVLVNTLGGTLELK